MEQAQRMGEVAEAVEHHSEAGAKQKCLLYYQQRRTERNIVHTVAAAIA